MKKTLLITSIVVVAALAVLGVGVVFAQGPNPGTGSMHTYMVAAFAEKLSLQVEDVNARLGAGESMYDIAVAAGVKAEDFPALLVEVRSQALAAAVQDGVITQAQADWMKSHGFGHNYGQGNCPMQNGQRQQQNRGAGMWNRHGHGMGGGWQGQQTVP
jgi:hypothetical protein